MGITRINPVYAATKSIAPVESVTATANHAVGDYFMLGDVLMKATAAIATGEQITTSNATPATVQSQIDALRNSVSGAIRIVEAKSASTGISANNATVIDVSISVPSGYTLVGAVGVSCNHYIATTVNIFLKKAGENVIRAVYRNFNNSAMTDQVVTVYALCVRSALVG